MTKPKLQLFNINIRAMSSVRPVPRESVDLVVTSPPYKERDGYSQVYTPITIRNALLNLLKPGGRAFINFGQLSEDFLRPHDFAKNLCSDSFVPRGSPSLQMQQTIIWAKSIAIDGHQHGHFQPINSKRILNYCWEYIFVVSKGDPKPLDRLAVGTPYADKSNLKRGTRGKNGDVHCSGDIWFIPYQTRGTKSKKRHAYEYPEELVERCIKLAGLKSGDTVADLFCGSGTTVVAAGKMGMNAVAFDIDAKCINSARERWNDEVVKPNEDHRVGRGNADTEKSRPAVRPRR